MRKIKRIMHIININDKQLNALLYTLKLLFNENKKPSLAHITIRGPYEKNIYKKQRGYIKKFIEEKPVIKIRGVGTFINSNKYVVYLKVECEELRSFGVWSKPDYNKEFNPHITIYKGNDREKANAISNFLKSENISFNLYDYEIEKHILSQVDLPNKLRESFTTQDINQLHYPIISNAKKFLSSYMEKKTKNFEVVI